MPVMRRLLAVATCLLVAACSSSSGGGGGAGSGNDFASQICAKLSSCSFPVSNCQAAFAAVVLSSSCQSTLLNASCSDLGASPPPASLLACIPNCTGTMTCTGSSASVTNSTCNGDGTVTECTNGSQFTYSCDGVCAAEGKTYVGTCALTYNGQSSPSGCPSCWCQ
jgi:hypothetical protein